MTNIDRLEAVFGAGLWIGDVGGQMWATDGRMMMLCPHGTEPRSDLVMASDSVAIQRGIAKLLARATRVSERLILFRLMRAIRDEQPIHVFRELAADEFTTYANEGYRRIVDGCTLRASGPQSPIYAYADDEQPPIAVLMPINEKWCDPRDMERIENEEQWAWDRALYNRMPEEDDGDE